MADTDLSWADMWDAMMTTWVAVSPEPAPGELAETPPELDELVCGALDLGGELACGEPDFGGKITAAATAPMITTAVAAAAASTRPVRRRRGGGTGWYQLG